MYKQSTLSLLSLSVLVWMSSIGNASANEIEVNARSKGENYNKNVTQLDKIVVTASGFEQDIKKAAASISVLTQEEINKKAYRDVTDALKDVPGVVVTGGGSSSDISIREWAVPIPLSWSMVKK